MFTPFDILLLNTPPKFLKDETKKIRKRIINKKWKSENAEKWKEQDKNYRENNREKEKERQRKYRENNREKEREKLRKWRSENPEKVKEKARQYRKNNREKLKESNRQYRENNREKFKERARQYSENNPDKIKKYGKKATWKASGLNMEKFEEIYERYINTTHCDLCNVELTIDKITTKTTKVMDHSHITGEFRNILCHSCNIRLPRGT